MFKFTEQVLEVLGQNDLFILKNIDCRSHQNFFCSKCFLKFSLFLN